MFVPRIKIRDRRSAFKTQVVQKLSYWPTCEKTLILRSYVLCYSEKYVMFKAIDLPL